MLAPFIQRADVFAGMPPKAGRKRKGAPTATKGTKRANNDAMAGKPPVGVSPSGHYAELPEKSAVARSTDKPTNANAPSYIDNLPDEILLVVLEYLDASYIYCVERIRQFQHICLTTRRLNRLSNNFLYEEFDSRYWRHPAKFLRTIIGNTDLASRVKTLYWAFDMENPHYTDVYEPTSAEQRHLRESLKRLNISTDRAELVDRYRKGDLGQLLKLAMLHTPNLRYLIVDDNTPSYRHVPRICYQEKSYLQLLGNAAQGTPVGNSPLYTHLHSLHIRMGDMWPEDLFPIFRLPSLRKIHIAGINWKGAPPDHELLMGLADTANVTDLMITESFADTQTLTHLIAACRSLKKFGYIYKIPPDLFPVPRISYAELGKALQKHKRSLEMLDLEDQSDRTMDALTEQDCGFLGSFDDFDKLVYFGAPMESFEPLLEAPAEISEEVDEDDEYIPFAHLARALPKSLLHLSLTIFEDEEQSDFCSESLRMLHKTYQRDLPHLHKIEVRAHKLVYLRSVDFWSPKTKFLRSGVHFSVTQDGVLEEDVVYSDDEDTITDSDLYDSEFDSLEDETMGHGLLDIDSEIDEDDDEELDLNGGLGLADHEMETFLDVIDGIQQVTHGVNATMSSMMPLLASLQAGQLHHHFHHQHDHPD